MTTHTDAVEDQASPPSSSRSSVNYNLGVLTEQVRQNTKITEELPARIMEVVGPRLVAVEAFGPRLTVLEQEKWLTRGGITVIVVAIGWLITATKPLTLHLR